MCQGHGKGPVNYKAALKLAPSLTLVGGGRVEDVYSCCPVLCMHHHQNNLKSHHQQVEHVLAWLEQAQNYIKGHHYRADQLTEA